MRRFLRILVLLGAAAAAYLAWTWVTHMPEPEKFLKKADLRGGGREDETDLSSHPILRIAVITPPKKAFLSDGPDLGTPARFCVDQINAQGGIKSVPIELVVLESENSALDSAQAAHKAVALQAVAVIGGYTSSGAMTSAEVLQKARIPLIVVGATNPDVTRIGDFVFRVNFIDSFQGAALADFAYGHLRARKAAILLNVGNRYGPYLAQVFAEQFRQFGGRIVWQKDYLPSPTGYAQLFKNRSDAEPDVIFVPGYEDDSAGVIRDARAAGVKAIFLGGDGWGPAMFEYAGDAVKDGFYTKAWHPEAGLAKGLHGVLDRWIEENGPIKRDSTALTLDACFLLFSAMERAETLSPESIREALSRTDGFSGIAGSYTFNANGDPDKPLTVHQLIRPEPALVKVLHPKTVKLGVILAKTGEAAEVNSMGFEAARYAAEEMNRLGGVLGHRINLIEYDNESNVLGSRKAAMQAVQDDVSAVIGASWSSHSSAIAPILQSARIPMVSPISTSPGVTLLGDFVFRTCYTDRVQGRVLADFALDDLKASRAAVLINANSEYSLGLGQFFRDRFNGGGKVVLEADYLQSTTDFKSLLEKVRQAEPDLVFVPGYPRDSVYVIRQARQMGIRSVFLGADGWNDVMYQYSSGELEGSYYSQHWHPDVPEEKSRAFYAHYAETHEMYRAGLVALTYDTVHLIADALRRAGTAKAEDIRKALSETRNFEGITGAIAFDENGDPLSKALVIMRFGREKGALHKVLHPKKVADSNPKEPE
jgi:branched-chain amino acid transport system substrate-binding protein